MKFNIKSPGEILKEEFMEPCEITTVEKLAEKTGINKMTLTGILKGSRKINLYSGWRLSKFFGMSNMFWINLQAEYNHQVKLENESSYEITTAQYWDCDCKDEYIQQYSTTVCNKCKAIREEQPDAMIIEVENARYAY